MDGEWAGRLNLRDDAALVLDRLSYSEITYEQGYANLVSLVEWYSTRHGSRNEATTRKHLIDKLLFACLGWQDEDVALEDHVSHIGYTDYTFALPRPILIVEAKKEGDYFDFPVGRYTDLSVGTLKRDMPNVRTAIDQVSAYCIGKGVQFAVVTNGHQLVVFAAIRTDGSAPDDGRAMIFDSLDAMKQRFLKLWNLLSRDSVSEGRIRTELLGTVAQPLPSKLSRTITDYPGVRARNPFQAELKAVSEYVLDDLTQLREFEARFLLECYCENGALAQYSLVAKAILKGRYKALFDDGNPGPAIEALTDSNLGEFFASAMSRSPVLLIGDVGVGKTTFVKHLLVADGSAFADDSIVLYIDLGSSQSITRDPRVSIVTDLKEQLRENYHIDIEAAAFVRDVYRGDLVRYSRGVFGKLRKTNPMAYDEREMRFLEQKLEQPERHLKSALSAIARSRRKHIVIVLDNCDQRSESTQEETFLIAHEMASQWDATVFVSLRPETFHASQRRGALSGYHPKAFSIAPPQTDEVIVKRLKYALRIARGEIAIGSYSGFGQLANMETIVEVFLHSLDRNVKLIECIENIAGGNVRFALNTIKQFFGSGHVNTRKIVDTQRLDPPYTVPLHEFMRALIYQDTVYYDPSKSPVDNLFDVSSHDPREHFLLPLLLGALMSTGSENLERGFVSTGSVYERLEALGFTPSQIDFAASRGIRKKLIDSVARRLPEAGAAGSPSIRITSVGKYHALRLARLFTYYDAVVVDTPVFDVARRAHIGRAATIFERLDRAAAFVGYLDSTWQRVPPDGANYFDWTTTLKDLNYNCAQVRRDATRAAAAKAARA
jgi:hypothetical protein